MKKIDYKISKSTILKCVIRFCTLWQNDEKKKANLHFSSSIFCHLLDMKSFCKMRSVIYHFLTSQNINIKTHMQILSFS